MIENVMCPANEGTVWRPNDIEAGGEAQARCAWPRGRPRLLASLPAARYLGTPIASSNGIVEGGSRVGW